jgi:hypothetical protein
MLSPPIFPLTCPLNTVDMNGEDDDSMTTLGTGKAVFDLCKLNGWINWVGRHPGIVLLGALVMTILTVQESPGTKDPEDDSSDEEVPLFI